VDTYGVRIEQYERRERMAIWVAAGIAALLAFVAARALDRAPRLFTQLVLTLVVLAGVAGAYVRVGFEWQATLLKRKTETQPSLKDAPLVSDDQKWPSFPEICWDVCLVVIPVAWIIMLLGIWWHQPDTHSPSPRTELQSIPIGSVGPFADCSAELPTAFENQLDAMVQNYNDHVTSNASATLVILVGAADNHRLAPPCAARFGTNEQLAISRARWVRARLEQKLLRQLVHPNYVVLSSGPKHLEARAEDGGRQQDRAVDAWVAIDHLVGSAARQP